MRRYFFVFAGAVCISTGLKAQHFSTNDMQRIAFTRNATSDVLSDLHYADFNKDGLIDVMADGGLATNQSSFVKNTSKPVFFINDGNGNLVPTATPFTHASNSSVISDIADYNNDGYPDMLVLDFWANGMRLYKGEAGLNFTLVQTLPTGTHGAKGYFEDLDGDGDLDIYNVSSGSAAVIGLHIFTNNGGNFTKTTYAPDNGDRKNMAARIWAKDVNHDGRKDIVATIGFIENVQGVGIWLQKPDKTFGTMQYESLNQAMRFGSFGSFSYTWEDLNDDGFEDFVFLNDRDYTDDTDTVRANAVYTTGTAPYLSSAPHLKGVGSEFFYSYRTESLQDMVTGDIDRDGNLDFVSCYKVQDPETSPRLLKVFIDPFNKNGNFMLQTIDLGNANITERGYGLLLTDLDRDDELELVSLGKDDTLRVFGLKPAAPTGIKKVSDAERPVFSIYPNPAEQVLYIQLTEPGKAVSTAVIYNIEGREVQKLTKVQLKSAVNIKSLAPGNYYMTLYNDKGGYYTQKFVKAQ